MDEVQNWETKICEPSARSSSFSIWDDEDTDSDVAKSRDNFLPCHYFDYIGGTSTGGLIAVMLGRYRMSIGDCINCYKELSEQVFGQRSYPGSWRKTFHLAASSRRKNIEEMQILKTLRPWQPSPDERVDAFQSDEVRCRTIVCSIPSHSKNDSSQPQLLCSYRPDKDLSKGVLKQKDFELAIVSVAQATLAAQNFVESADLNNPSFQIFKEVKLTHSRTPDPVLLFLSLGCGDPKSRSSRTNSSFKLRGQLANSQSRLEQRLSSVSDFVHHEMKEMKERSQAFYYYRFDVKENLNTVRLSEWKPLSNGARTLRAIEEATKTYLRDADIVELIRDCAHQLVDLRRKRSDTMRWESFARGTRYRCKVVPPCDLKDEEDRPMLFRNRNELMDHLRIYHKQPPPDANNYKEIQALVDRGRTNSD